MLFLSDFEVAKSMHKEREQAAQQGWLMEKHLDTSEETNWFSIRFGQWLDNLRAVFDKTQDKRRSVSC